MPLLPVLVALADPTRCRIIEILRDGAQPVHVLAGSFDISRPAISRHLRVLKQAKLISEKKAGRENRYALHPHRLKPVREWLDTLAPDNSAAKPAKVTPAPLAKPRRKPRPKPITAQPDQLVPTPAAAAPSAAPVPAKPAGDKPVAQMGFDF